MDIAKAFTLTIVRHGQTTHNKLKIIQGQFESQLTDLGRDQAKLLRDYYEATSEKFDKVYSSDLIRAFETCQIICNGKYEIIKDQLLRERSFGVLQGQPMDELRTQAYKAGYNENNFTEFQPEGGETMRQVFERIERFCNEELYPNTQNGQSILLVTHGGVIREFMKLFKNYGCELSRKDMIISPNTGVNQFEIKLNTENRAKEIVVKFLHSIRHLEASGDAKSEALNEEQLNEASMKKEVEYAI